MANFGSGILETTTPERPFAAQPNHLMVVVNQILKDNDVTQPAQLHLDTTDIVSSNN